MYLISLLYGGLSNQIYGFVDALLMAKKTGRKLVLPKLALRTEPTDFFFFRPDLIKFNRSDKRADFIQLEAILTQNNIRLVEFSHLFKIDESLKDMIVREIPTSLQDEPIKDSKKYLSESSNPLEYYHPSLKVRCSTSDEVAWCRGVIKGMTPSNMISKYTEPILNRLLQNGFNCLHYRSEEDWVKAVGSVPTIAHIISLAHDAFAKSPVPLYLVGKHCSETINHFKQNWDQPVIYKSDILPQIETELGFEELALVDQWVARYSDKFLGCCQSTFSGIIYIHRFPCKSLSYNTHSRSMELYQIDDKIPLHWNMMLIRSQYIPSFYQSHRLNRMFLWFILPTLQKLDRNRIKFYLETDRPPAENTIKKLLENALDDPELESLILKKISELES